MTRAASTRTVVDVIVEDPRWRRALPGLAPLARGAVRRALAAGARERGWQLRDAGVSLVFADDDFVAGLNARWRRRRGATNVLSFPARDAPPDTPPDMVAGAGAMPIVLGDVVLAYQTTRREAAAMRRPFADHVRHLIVHGVLHLLGHDHRRDGEAAAMEAIEIAVLAQLGVANPYGNRHAERTRR
ncbi:MAG: rRNA maturation RNase YbeY [Alphaproteobacteria bacterium]|nr:rRNA maturation RNase YbeY [Alphaproteobacteria bacterium]